MTPRSSKCFKEDVPKDSILKVKVSILDEIPVSSDQEGIMSSIFPPKSKSVHKKTVAGVGGTHTIVSQEYGLYKICIEPTAWFFKLYSKEEARVSIEISTEKELDQKFLNSLDWQDLHE